MAEVGADARLARDIARLLDESRFSHTLQRRKIKELAALRSSSYSSSTYPRFFPAFSRVVTPLFAFSRRTPSSERAVRFVAAFAAGLDGGVGASEFLEEFLRFLLMASAAADRSCRLRACQIISEIIMRLPEDVEVPDPILDELIDLMKQRVDDKVPAIRVFAVQSLSRFSNNGEDGEILNLFLRILPQEPNAEVRKAIVLLLPASNSTSIAIVESTLDSSELVRKAAYSVLAAKFPLQSLSIKLRTTILQRGLSDRSPSVSKECLRMLKDEWLIKSCNGDLVSLLRFLDVETYESVGEAVMEALLGDGSVRPQEIQSFKQYLAPSGSGKGDFHDMNIQLMEPEVSLYWRTLCNYLLHAAQAKGSDAAIATGAEATVYASEASAHNDLLDKLLPATVSDFVAFTKAHLAAGPNYSFASRQLLLLGSVLDFSDVSNRRVASAFIQELLLRPLEYEVDDNGNKIVIGDGINLGGDKDWSWAVTELAKKVYGATGEFEDVLSGVVNELALPCRERTADSIQWMHCLAVTGLLLTNIKSLTNLQGKAIEPPEILHSLLLPGAKQGVVAVQRVSARCLCLYGLLERSPSEELVKQLRLLFATSHSTVSVLAAKSLFDLAMSHGIEKVDNAIGITTPQSEDEINMIGKVDFSNLEGTDNISLLDLLYSGLQMDTWGIPGEPGDDESVQAVLMEGFSKFLILARNYPRIPSCLLPSILSRLIILYFSEENKEQLRMKQCLSVFFEHYPTLSYDNKKCISSAFIPVMRSMWPGINGNAGDSPHLVSRMRKRATQAARFMLQMIQAPLFSKKQEKDSSQDNAQNHVAEETSLPDLESGEEGLAIRIAAEVIHFPEKKSAAGKSYISALCRIVVLLSFRASEQDSVKCMRRLLNGRLSHVSLDKELSKDLNRMVSKLKSMDENPDQELPQDRANAIFSVLGLAENVKLDTSPMRPSVPATRGKRHMSSRRRAVSESSTDEDEADQCPPSRTVPLTPSVLSVRSQRASKTEAMSRISAKINVIFSDDEGDSDVTSDEI